MNKHSAFKKKMIAHAVVVALGTLALLSVAAAQTTDAAATSAQKADALSTIDELIEEVKKSRQRSNTIEVNTNEKIGKTIVDLVMKSFKSDY